MVGWIILGVLVALLLLILLLPIGVDLGNDGGSFHLSAKVSGLLIQILPKREKEKKPKKEKPKKKKKKKKETEEEGEEKPKKKRSLPFNRDELLELLRVVLKGIGRFGRAWHVDRFLLHYTAGGGDPADTAVTFGKVNAALSGLAPLCRKRFRVKDCSVRTELDFLAERSRVEFGLALTVTLWRLFGVINRILFGGLKILLRSKRRRKKEAKALKRAQKQSADEAAKEAPKETADETVNQENKETNTIQEEERMAENG